MQRLLTPARTILRHRTFMVLLGCNLLVGLAFAFVAPFFSMFGTIEVGMSPFALRRLHDGHLVERDRDQHPAGPLV